MPDENPTVAKPIFIVGAMRSGTTMLAEMLGRSAHIAHCPFELKDVWSQAGGIPMASAKTRDSTCPECSENDLRRGQREALTEIFLQRMAACDAKANHALFLNKNPHLCNKLPLVNALFPDARFIWIHRELPRVVASVRRLFADVCQRQGTWHWWPYPSETTRNRCWNAFYAENTRCDIPPERIFPGGDVRFIAEYWLEANRAVSDYFKRLPLSCRVMVAEEALVADPGKELAAITAQLEIPSIEKDQMADKADTARNEEWHSLLDEHQLNILADFFRAHADEIEGILPGRHAWRDLAPLGSIASQR